MGHKTLYSAELDFQSSDEAWYTVRLVLRGDMLIVKYCNFSAAHDEQFTTADFKDLKAMESFATRFRPTSVQLQDNECRKVIEGITVCASYKFGEDDLRFYDAVVEEVNFKDHKFEKEEECTCKFVLFWLFGPNEGNKTEAVITNICLLQKGNAQMDPTLSCFIEVCRDKQKTLSLIPARVSEGDTVVYDTSKVHKANMDSFINNKSRTKEVKISVSAAGTSKVRSTNHVERFGEDADLGGRRHLLEEFTEAPDSHFLLLDNLEKDLSPSTIVDFVRSYLSLSSKAQVFPSLSSEPFTKGIVMVYSQVALQKLSDFLNNPSHIVLSSKGRPWVVMDKAVWCGAMTANLTMLSERYRWDRSPEVGDQLRVISSGTNEYERGKKRKDIFLEFTEHHRVLHQRLAVEESKILQSSVYQEHIYNCSKFEHCK